MFKLSMKDGLTLTAWAAIWFANIASVDWYESFYWMRGTLASSLFYSLVVIPPAAGMGIICRHPITGVLCGLASVGGMLLMGLVQLL